MSYKVCNDSNYSLVCHTFPLHSQRQNSTLIRSAGNSARAVNDARERPDIRRREAGHNPSASMNAHPNEKFPDPWLFDTQALIAELDRVRELVLAIPVRAESFGAINTATLSIWDLRERIRYLTVYQMQAQERWSTTHDQQESAPPAQPRHQERGRKGPLGTHSRRAAA